MEGQFSVIKNKDELIEFLDEYINFHDFQEPLFIQTSKQNKRLSFKQRGSLHVWCEQLAKELNYCGLTQEVVIAQMKVANREWSKGGVKEALYKPMAKAFKDKNSSEDLGGGEPSDVVYELKKFIQKRFPDVNFPEWPVDKNAR